MHCFTVMMPSGMCGIYPWSVARALAEKGKVALNLHLKLRPIFVT